MAIPLPDRRVEAFEETPIALVEAQGYAYPARRGMATLFAQTGDHDRASNLNKQANDLKQRFTHDFWLGDDPGYAPPARPSGLGRGGAECGADILYRYRRSRSFADGRRPTDA